MLIYRNIKYPIGSVICFRIKGEEVVGKLQHDGYHYYVCHNNPDYDGKFISDKFGYNYSWAFSIHSGILSSDVEILSKVGDKDGFDIDPTLSEILNSFDSSITSLLSIKGILPNYIKFKISKKAGLIEIVNDKGFMVELKIGRLLRALSNISESFTFTDKDIETFHNRYLSYQNGDIVDISYVKGNDILDIYKTDNYLTVASRLGKSCMNNALSYLSLYTDNPDVVEAVVIKKYGKIVGRAILWTLTDGAKLLDRTYTSSDWVDEKYTEIVKSNNYLNCYDNKKLKVQVKPGVIDKEVPYLDTLYFYNNKTGILSNYNYPSEDRLYRFRNTDGTY